MAKDEGDLPELAKAGPCRMGCGKELGVTPWGRKRHERRCKGPEEGKPVQGKPRKARAVRNPRPSSTPNGSAIPAAIKELEARHQQIIDGIPELKEIDDAIRALEALEKK